MAVIRSYTNGFEVTDLTEELMIVPNEYGLVNQLGLFGSEGVSQHTITFEQIDETIGLIKDKVRGERANVNKGGKRLMRSYAIPHFPLDDAIYPSDIQGKRAYGSEGVETKNAVMARKLKTLRRSHGITIETARMQAITKGTIYAPNGTVVGNYYTDFGVTRKEVAMDLANPQADIIAKQRDIIDHIQENILSGEVPAGFIALCSPEYFDKYVANAQVKDAYKYYTSTQEILRKGTPIQGRYTSFEHGNVTLYRYIGSYKDADGKTVDLVPKGDAYYMPTGTEGMFKSYFSPANKFDLVNTIGEEGYVFTYEDGKGSETTIESEHNAIHLIKRPQVIVRAVAGDTP